MAGPSTSITQYACGASGHNDNVAIGTFTQATSQAGGAETTLWIHLGFVPKVFILMNVTADEAFMWFNSMPALSAINLEDSDYLTGEGIAGADCSVTTIGPTATLAGLPGTYYYNYVPADDVYIKEGVVYTSGAYARDEVIGVKIYDGGGDNDVLGTDEDQFHYVAIR